MKTIEALYREVLRSETMKKEFLALRPDGIEAFAKKYGCSATKEEILTYFREKKQSGALSDEEMEQIAGGKAFNTDEMLGSIFSAGILCALTVVGSLAHGNVGTAIEEDCMLCDATVSMEELKELQKQKEQGQ